MLEIYVGIYKTRSLTKQFQFVREPTSTFFKCFRRKRLIRPFTKRKNERKKKQKIKMNKSKSWLCV